MTEQDRTGGPDLADLVLVDVEAALALLPEPERDAYRRAQKSVIDARSAAERESGAWSRSCEER